MVRKLNLNEKRIIYLYVKENKSMVAIAKRFNCSDVHIRNILIKKNINLRSYHQSKIEPLNKRKFEKLLMNKNFHYFLGFYAGDGTKGKSFLKKGRFNIGLKDTKKNKELLEKFRNILINIRSITNSSEYTENQGNGKIKQRYLFHKKAKKIYKMVELSFGLQTLKFRLDMWGMNFSKHKTFTIPNYYYNNKENFGVFIAGLIDADGCFNFSNKTNSAQIFIYLEDKESMMNLKKALNDIFNLTTKYYNPKLCNFFPLRFNSNNSSKEHIKKLEIMNKYIFPNLKLKKEESKKLKLIYSLK